MECINNLSKTSSLLCAFLEVIMQSDFCKYVNGFAKHVYHHQHVFVALWSSLDGCRMDAMILVSHNISIEYEFSFVPNISILVAFMAFVAFLSHTTIGKSRINKYKFALS